LKKSLINSFLVRDTLLQNIRKAEQVGEGTNSPFEKDFFLDDGEQAFMRDSAEQGRAKYVKEIKRGIHGLCWEWASSPSSLLEQAFQILSCRNYLGLTIDSPEPS